MSRSSARQNVREVIASALYVENWYLAWSSVDYLAADNEPSVVQHYWSLSVEEQFYVLWPILIVAALWVGSRLRIQPRTSVFVAASAVAVLSFAQSIAGMATPGPAYFSTATRAWEFAAGALVAFVPTHIVRRRRVCPESC